MRLTALCLCGSLLAFSSLFWTTADSDEGGENPLGDQGFGPCSASLRPEGACRQGPDEDSCPYLFSLPPLTFHLPKQLRELEKIVEDLQKLKDNVDQLRKMCADCTVSQSERECERQKERENEGAEGYNDDRSLLNEGHFGPGCRTDRVKEEDSAERDRDSDFEKRRSLEEKEREKWEEERVRDEKIVKVNEKDAVAAKYGKSQPDGAQGRDKLGQEKVATASENEKIVDYGKNNRETEAERAKEKDTGRNSKEGGEEKRMKNRDQTDQSDHHVRQDERGKETGEKTETEDRPGDGIKMSEGRGEHTNKEREQQTRREMEKGIKVERDNEKPKQTESIGRAERERTIKEEEEEEEEDGQIQTEAGKPVQSVQRDGDGELASSKSTEGTDFVSISPADSIISLAPGHHSSEAITVTSSLPSPLSSSAPLLITDVHQALTRSADGLQTQSPGLRTGGFSKQLSPVADAGVVSTTTATMSPLGGPGQEITSASTLSTFTTRTSPGSGFKGRVSSTMATTTTKAPHQYLNTTTLPGAADRSRWAAEKNISSNTKTGMKPPAGRAPKPGERQKPAVKPEEGQKLKNPKNDRKPDRAHLPEAKYEQKQKPSSQKPQTEQKSKPGKDPKHVQIQKPGLKHPSYDLPTDQNWNVDQDQATDRNQVPSQQPKSNQKSLLPVQRPTSQTANASGSHKDPQTDQDSQYVEVSVIPKNPETKPVHPSKTSKPDQKPPKDTEVEERTKPDQMSTSSQSFIPVQEPEPEGSETLSLKPSQNPVIGSTETSDDKLPPGVTTNKDPKPGETPDHTLFEYTDQSPKPGENILKISQKPKPGQASKPHQPSFSEPSESLDKDTLPGATTTKDSTPGHTPDRTLIQSHDEMPRPDQEIPKINQRPKPGQASKPHKPSFSPSESLDEEPLPGATNTKHSIPGLKPDQTLSKSPDQMTRPGQKNPKRIQKPKPGQPSKPDQTSFAEPSKILDVGPSPTVKGWTTAGQSPDSNLTDSSVRKSKPGQKIPKINLRPKPGQPSKPKQTPFAEPSKSLDEDPLPGSTTTKDWTPGVTPDHTLIASPDQKPKAGQKIPKINQKTKPGQASKPKQPYFVEPAESLDKGSLPGVKPTKDSIPGLKPGHIPIKSPDQNPKPGQNIPKSNQKPKPVQPSKPAQTSFAEPSESLDEDPLPTETAVKDSSSGLTPDHILFESTDQKPKPGLKIPKINQKQQPGQPSTPEQTYFAEPSESLDEDPIPTETTVKGSTPGLTPGQSPGSILIESPAQKPKPGQKFPKINQKQQPGQPSKPEQSFAEPSESFDKDPLLTEKTIKDLTSDHTLIKSPDEKPRLGQKIPNINQKPKPGQAVKPSKPSFVESSESFDEDPLPESETTKDSTPGLKPDHSLIKSNDQTSKPGQKIPKITPPKPGQPSKPDHPKVQTGQKTKASVKPKPHQTPQSNPRRQTTWPDQKPNIKSLPEGIPKAGFNKTSQLRPPPKIRPPTRPTVKPGATPAEKSKPAVQLKPSSKTKTDLDPHKTSRMTSDSIQNSQTDQPPASDHVKQVSEVTRSPEDTELKPKNQDHKMKTVTLAPKASNSLETGPFPHLHAHSEGLTTGPNSRRTSDLRPQTAGPPPSIPTTTRPNTAMRAILPSVVPSFSPGYTQPDQASDAFTESSLNTSQKTEETTPTQNPDKVIVPVPSPVSPTASTTNPDLRLTTPATSGPEPFNAESSTPSARELRVKINQVAAFLNNSLGPNKRPEERLPEDLPEDISRPDGKEPRLKPSKATLMRRDCSDLLLRGETDSGVYLVTPDLRSRSFQVFCDMELDGGGWTLLQRRQDGSVSFNRTWADYRGGFGELDGGEFWLGNNMIHLLTRDRDMVLRVELEDFEGVMEYAEYELFRVASERMRYRLTVGGYSGTAGDALRFSKTYDHNNRAFTTPDRDHDRYPSGNCGAYYSSGWWFDACMAANLNGRYHIGAYKGVRDGIFWGTWHNISTEYYPTNDRQSFKTVRMMIRPKGFKS